MNHLTDSIKGVKIAVLKTVKDELKDARIRQNFDEVVEKLKAIGAIVEEVELPRELMKTLLPAYTIIANSEATSNHSCLDGIKYGHRAQGQTTDKL